MAGLRISGGVLRGRRIPLPTHDLRPTSERARQAFFNIIGERIQGATFLDLFAGSGIFSFEAISRGATSAYAIEAARKAADGIKQWAGELELPIQVTAEDVFAGLKRLPSRLNFDVVYADPPYDYPRHRDLIETLDARLLLSAEAVVALEHRRNAKPFDELELTQLRCDRTVHYGEVSISFFERTVEKE